MKKIAFILAIGFAFVACDNDDETTPTPVVNTDVNFTLFTFVGEQFLKWK